MTRKMRTFLLCAVLGLTQMVGFSFGQRIDFEECNYPLRRQRLQRS